MSILVLTLILNSVVPVRAQDASPRSEVSVQPEEQGLFLLTFAKLGWGRFYESGVTERLVFDVFRAVEAAFVACDRGRG